MKQKVMLKQKNRRLSAKYNAMIRITQSKVILLIKGLKLKTSQHISKVNIVYSERPSKGERPFLSRHLAHVLWSFSPYVHEGSTSASPLAMNKSRIKSYGGV